MRTAALTNQEVDAKNCLYVSAIAAIHKPAIKVLSDGFVVISHQLTKTLAR